LEYGDRETVEEKVFVIGIGLAAASVCSD
jgi:hypothetical protein